MKSKVKGFIFPALAVLTVSAFPSLFLYCRNADEAGFSEIVPALLVSLAAGLVLFVLAFIFTRNAGKAAISASLLMLVMLNFTFLENGLKLILPRLKYWHTIPIILVLALHMIYFLCHYLKNETAGDVTKVLCMVFGGLIVLNVAISTPQIINHVKAQRELKEALSHRGEQQGTASEDMPNVYLLIFDEYANFPQMEEYYNYDNAPLKEFLEENNFNISYTSHNESIVSSTIQTNLANLDYVVDNYTSKSDKSTLRKNGALFKLMEDNGYCVKKFESVDFYGGKLPGDASQQSQREALTINGDNLQTILQSQSILYPLLYVKLADVTDLLDKRVTILTDYMSDEANIPVSGTFTLLYVCFPHQPFLVDEDGNAISPEQWENWQDPKYYLGQYKFATKQMLKILNNIITNDPESVIFLQSDHGARASTDSEFMTKFPLNVMNNPLNAVYYLGEKHLDIEGLSSVNTLRLVLGKLFDIEFSILDVPVDDYKYK